MARGGVFGFLPILSAESGYFFEGTKLTASPVLPLMTEPMPTSVNSLSARGTIQQNEIFGAPVLKSVLTVLPNGRIVMS